MVRENWRRGIGPAIDDYGIKIPDGCEYIQGKFLEKGTGPAINDYGIKIPDGCEYL